MYSPWILKSENYNQVFLNTNKKTVHCKEFILGLLPNRCFDEKMEDQNGGTKAAWRGV